MTYCHHENQTNRSDQRARSGAGGRLRRRLFGASAAVFVLASAIVMVAAIALTGLKFWPSQDIRLLSVQSGSMRPTLQPGDAVVVRAVQLSELRRGDIVSFYDPTQTTTVVTHRVVAINQQEVITQGDSNATADRPLDPSLLIGRSERQLANAGYLIDFIYSPAGLIAGIYLPAAMLIVIELQRLTAYYRPAYRLATRW